MGHDGLQGAEDVVGAEGQGHHVHEAPSVLLRELGQPVLLHQQKHGRPVVACPSDGQDLSGAEEGRLPVQDDRVEALLLEVLQHSEGVGGHGDAEVEVRASGGEGRLDHLGAPRLLDARLAVQETEGRHDAGGRRHSFDPKIVAAVATCRCGYAGKQRGVIGLRKYCGVRSSK